MHRNFFATCAIMLLLFLLTCSQTPLRGGSDNPDFKAMGVVLNANGSPAAEAQVTLRLARFNPVIDDPSRGSWTAVTDFKGRYSFSEVPPDTYTITATGCGHYGSLIIGNIIIAHDSTIVPTKTLQPYGTITLNDGIAASGGYLYVPGTMIARTFSGSTKAVVIDSLPPGTLPAICYKPHRDSAGKVIRYDVEVKPNDTAAIVNPAWSHVQRIGLVTTAAGAGVSETVTKFPVLVRLTSSNFNISECKPGGADLMFTKADNSVLPYEIESWDATGKQAAIWVGVDTVWGNNDSQYFYLYWGKSDASPQSNSAAVFDTAAGFQGVWHLGNAGDTIKDATVNGFDGIPVGSKTPVLAAAAIGSGRHFDRSANFFTIPQTASGKLNFPQNGVFTVSAWVYADVIDSNYYYAIVSKGDLQYTLQIRPPTREWEFYDFVGNRGWYATRSPSQAQTWTHLVGVRSGNNEVLYVNGVQASSGMIFTADNRSRTSGFNVSIGNVPDATYTRFFIGTIDEVRISNTARSASWVRLCYMNQKSPDALTIFKK